MMTHDERDDDRQSFTHSAKAQRLDAAMVAVYDDVSRSYLGRLIDDGHVNINGTAVTKKGKKLQNGDEVSVFFAPAPELQLEPEDLELDVLFEDEDVIFVNKPAGMVLVHI